MNSDERCISVERAKVPSKDPEDKEQTVEKRKRGRPKGKQMSKVEKQPKKRGRPPKHSNVDLKSMAETLEKHMNKGKTVPIRTSKHELSRILKDTRIGDIKPVGSGVLTRAQKKKLLNMFVVDYTPSDSSHEIFVTKDDVKLKECVDGPEFSEPKVKEWAAWQRNDSFEWVKDEGQPRVRCRWVLTKRRVFTKQQLVKILKKEIDVSTVPMVVKVKARLTPQGTVNQDPEREHIECESPTADKISIRCLLSLAANGDWDIETFDVSEAFLQQLPMKDLEGIVKRGLYVSPPNEFKRPGYLMKMKKAACGFADAPRRWFMTSDKVLKEIGFKSSKIDPATYYLRLEDSETKEQKLHGMICLHVDDGLCAGDKIFRERLAKYYATFKVNPEKGSEGTVEYTGAELAKSDGLISMSQKLYSAYIAEPELKIPGERMKQPDEPLNELEINALRQYCGMLGWPSNISRPDLASETNMLQTSMSNPKISDLKTAQKLFRKLKATGDSRLDYINVKGSGGSCLMMFSDASNHNLKDEEGNKTQSQAGWVLVAAELGNDDMMPIHPKANILGWRSFKIKRTCRSSFAAETIAAVEAADALIFTGYLYEELTGRNIRKFLVVDSMNLKDHTCQFNNNLTERRLKIDMYSLKENVTQGEFKILWIDDQENVADAMTKASACALKPLLDLMSNNRIPVENMLAMVLADAS